MNDCGIDYRVTGAERGRLARAVAAYAGEDAEYLGAPTFAYRAGPFTIGRDGRVSSDGALPEGLAAALAKEGFAAAEPLGLTVCVPLGKAGAENLSRLLEAKGGLIKKALGVEDLPVEAGEDGVASFPWFKELPRPEETAAYTHFIAALCKLSSELRRAVPASKPVANEKYAFRCFLLRLGFIGKEYKGERKILLRNLTGSSAFKDGGKRNEVSK